MDAMFQTKKPKGPIGAAFVVLELIYYSIVRDIRQQSRSPILGLLQSIMNTLIMLSVFYLLMTITGLKKTAIRGDFVLYLMTGIFIYMGHTRTVQAVFGAASPTNQMLKHAPLTTAVLVSSAALSILYTQVLTVVIILYVYHAAWGPIHIENWMGALSMLLLAWFVGIGVGLIFAAMRPWAPQVVALIMMFYIRANMIASGKMFVANTLPHKMLMLFSWNPLFHIIDQARGFTFINYTPHYSNWVYPLIVGIALLMIGLLGEFYTRQHASVSWGAGH